jgi:TPR repeat protein
MRALKGAGIILAGIVGAAAVIFLAAVYIAGLLWVSENVFDYLNIAAIVAFAVCIFILLPCALFRVTQIFSAYGFFISSVIFGVATWILGFLVTFQHWGVTGLFVGLFLAGVGIVPIGILALVFNADWPQVSDLALGLVLTFGARTIALWLTQRIDRDEAGISANSLSKYTAAIIRSPIPYGKEKWRALVRFDRIQSQQIIMTALYVLIVGGLAVRGIFDPARYDYQQAMVNFQYHPIASVSGALLPALIFSPLVYWMFGWILRRNAARFKKCEHCAETIKAAAKVCRYCGRNVAPAGLSSESIATLVEARPAQVALVGATDQASILPNQFLRPGLLTALTLGLALVGGVGVWLADKQRMPIPSSVPNPVDDPSSFNPDTYLSGHAFEDAAAAYNKGDYSTAARLYRPLADEGNLLAQYNLGLMYAKGQGVPRNDIEAVRWYRLAADRGCDLAQYNLGLMYGDGQGVPKNEAEAMKWFRLAADQGYVAGQFNLGLMYAKGQGVPRNDIEAAKWYTLAANQGGAQAQHNLGLMYAEGQGVPKNEAEAVRWYRLAADQGAAIAQLNLGLMYIEGRGVPQNDAEAVKWWQKAADQGVDQAQYNLGVMYTQGRGLQKNYVLAHMWYNLAAKQGNQDAIKNQNLVAQLMTPAQIAEALRLARAWRPKSASGDALLSDADIGLPSDAPTPKQSVPSWDSLPDAPQSRPR